MGLVDILFAYAYNHRTTEGENTVCTYCFFLTCRYMITANGFIQYTVKLRLRLTYSYFLLVFMCKLVCKVSRIVVYCIGEGRVWLDHFKAQLHFDLVWGKELLIIVPHSSSQYYFNVVSLQSVLANVTLRLRWCLANKVVLHFPMSKR